MMKKLIVAVMLLALCSLAVAQTEAKKPEPAKPADLGAVLDRSLSGVEKNMVGMAEAMPEEKYNFVPKDGEFKDVRTFALQVRHVAAANYALGAMMAGEKPPVDPGPKEDGPELKTKAEVVRQLKDSFVYLHKVLGSLGADKAYEPIRPGSQATKLGLAIMTISHVDDHYGQCVVYLRMNGIVPPASRKQ